VLYINNMEYQDKLNQLKAHIKKLGSLAVAYSGGVDSTFLLKVAHDVLRDRVIAVTARSATYPHRELREASALARKIGVKHIIIRSNELSIKGFFENQPNRCYWCKYELFSQIKTVAEKHHIRWIAEGSNPDDLDDYRPGMKAIRELGIISPLQDAALGKEAIRKLSRKMKLPTWNKPAFACLASRLAYGEKITPQKLDMVDKAEQYLFELGFRQVRVRYHGNIARIEVADNETEKFLI